MANDRNDSHVEQLYLKGGPLTAPIEDGNVGTSLSIGTFNASFLHADLFGKEYFEPIPYTKERLQLLPDLLRESGLDVIGLQEVYAKEDKMFLIESLKDDFPYALFYESMKRFSGVFENGLLFLSKKPIQSSSFELYDENPIIDKILAHKGILSAYIKFAGEDLAITNTHTTMGGALYDTESQTANNIRYEQIMQAIEVNKFRDVKNNIILGDFNAGPRVSRVDYQIFSDAGYQDSYGMVCSDSCLDVTWEPKNKLNISTHYPDSPPQRIDNIFFKKGLLEVFSLIEGGVIFKDELLDIESEKYTLSDHYGYFVRLELNKQS